ncbi:tetratricopeptide repeat protein [Actinoplanes sp. NEAU-A12]|uniref:Tetratricopeptide repeat protein n=1 Tax=Actinoplanes sandaracinus TaxID=3045177 RepID=A0ABT6WGM8_9ACTN|nr:tetratricopeptide repeat protein [Actinoplanes sandaracinus]MDI6098853.1 tetratricopeptide repeat protein [Actinoplanes sandaracinus]
MGARVTSDQIVEVFAEWSDGGSTHYRHGSGLLVSGALVLTAAHNLGGSACRLTVRSGKAEYDARALAAGDDKTETDIAVLQIDDPSFRRIAPTVEFYAVDRVHLNQISQCKAVGFPRFGVEVLEKAADGSDRIRRESVQVNGSISSGSNLKSQLLTLLVGDDRPDESYRSQRTGGFYPSSSGKRSEGKGIDSRSSPWSGMSGAAVIVKDPAWGEGVIGLVVEHPLSRGAAALTVAPIVNIDTAFGQSARHVWSLLGVSDATRLSRVPSETRLPVQRRSVDIDVDPPLSDFTGHTASLRQLTDAVLGELALGGRPVVVIAGMAGVGKTTLATHVAHELDDRFHHARIVVRLHGKEADEATVTRHQQRVLRAFGVSDDRLRQASGHPDDLNDLYLSMIDAGPSLVIVDDPASEQDVLRFAPRRPGSVLIATSRTTLSDLDGAVHVLLKPWSEGASLPFLVSLLGQERVAAEPEAARTILAATGGLPLAIRLLSAFAISPAGARMSLKEIAGTIAEEETRLDRFSRKGRSVHATIFVSYRHLTPSTASFFRRICLLGVPDLSRALVTMATDTSGVEAIAALSELMDAHLLEHVRGDRYRMHDLVRLFGSDVARAEESPAAIADVQERWRRYYAEEAARWDSELTSEGERLSPAALDWFDIEEANIKATLVAASAAQDWETVYGLAARLRPPLAYRGRFREYAEVARAGIEAAEQGQFVAQAVAMMVHLAEARRHSGDPEGVDDLYERAEGLAAAAGDVAKQTWIGVHRGDFALEQGRGEDAVDHYDRVDEIYTERSDNAARVWVSGHYVDGYLSLGRTAQAVERGELAVELSLSLDDPAEAAWAHKHLARALQVAGQYPEAIGHMTQALEHAEQTGDLGARVDCLRRLGWIARDAGDRDAAEDYLEQALQGAEALDIKHLIEELGADLRNLR